MLVRYADDLVVLCPSRKRAEQARRELDTTLEPLGLFLHPDKTSIVQLTRGEQGFDFLGFHHRMRKSWRQPGRYYLQKWPSARAMASIKAKVRQRTHRRYASTDLDIVVANLNSVLRGWGAYFRHGNSTRKFQTVDCYVRQRMARLASIKHGLRGTNWTTRFNYQWAKALGIHELSGTVGNRSAHARR